MIFHIIDELLQSEPVSLLVVVVFLELLLYVDSRSFAVGIGSVHWLISSQLILILPHQVFGDLYLVIDSVVLASAPAPLASR